jgi:hypothetical protein
MPETATQTWTLGFLIILLTAVYQATLGPVGYMLVAEIQSVAMPSEYCRRGPCGLQHHQYYHQRPCSAHA